MYIEDFAKVSEALSRGGLAYEAISNSLLCAAGVANTECAFIAIWHEDHMEIIASVGMPFSVERKWLTTPGQQALFSKPRFHEDAATYTESRSMAPLFQFPWRKVISAPIKLNKIGHLLTLMCVDTSPSIDNHAEVLDTIVNFAGIIRSQMKLISEIVSPLQRVHAAEEVASYIAEPVLPLSDHSDVVSSFLFKTLISKHRVLSRNEISYHSSRQWRLPIKDHQVAALKLLKSHPPPAFVEDVALEIVAQVHKLVGINAFNVVTAVPCGHSGSGCLSDLLGKMVARKFGLPFIEMFAPLQVSGSSHPKTNSKRPHMNLVVEPKGSVLLVDDVATSGSHISEACGLLRGSNVAALPIVWIAA